MFFFSNKPRGQNKTDGSSSLFSGTVLVMRSEEEMTGKEAVWKGGGIWVKFVGLIDQS